MISHFFIDRPIFATVLSIVIVLTGGIALVFLPIAQYPPITPPSVQVAISYPGASAQVVSDTVAAPIEQQVNGVEGMLYMSSQMGNDGSYTLTVTFDIGTDLNTSLVMVQNRVALALPQLPNSVQQQGITIKKKTPDLLMVVNFLSPDKRYDDIYLSNFATIYIRDELLRIEGVSDITFMGERDYSIRAWLDPQKLAACNMTAIDVAAAIRRQNVESAIGQLGQEPSSRNQTFQLPVNALGRLTEPEQFGDIIVKVGALRPPAPTTGVTMPRQSSSTQPKSLSSTTIQNQTTKGRIGTSSTTTSNPVMTEATISNAQVTVANSLISTSNSLVSGFRDFSIYNPGNGVSYPGQHADRNPTPDPASLTPLSIGANSQTSDQGTEAAPASGLTSRLMIDRGPARPSTSIVRLRDVARLEMGAQNYTQSCTFDGQPSVGLAVRQLPGTNALDIVKLVRKKMEELKGSFPDGIEYQISYDTTPFIQESVDEVVHTLLEAVGLVALVVLTFLQSWRAAIIPLVAVPVAIFGTFAVMAVLGFSLNNISLFGLVLAIGIVVDDAIVVVENVERWLEQGLPPREATVKAMVEVTGPVVAVAIVLCAVFVPCAFISGITGQFFRQFAVTIAVSTMFSAFNSLTLSPALAALLLRPRDARPDIFTRLLNRVFGWFFKLFNRGFDAGSTAYDWVVGKFLRFSAIVLMVYAGLLVLTVWVIAKAPTGFIPQQDQGRLIINVQLPDSASLNRTQEAIALIDSITRKTPGVAHTITISGISFALSATSSNFGSMFVILDPFEARQKPELHDTAIMARLRKEWKAQVKDAVVTVFGAPPVPGLSVAGGFKLMAEDRAGLGLDSLQAQSDHLIQALSKSPALSEVSTQFRSNTPQYYMDIDRTKVESLGVALGDLNQTLQMYLGSLYVNSFNAFGRYWQVTIQAEGNYRDRIEDINLLKVRNKWGQMVSVGTLVNVREIGGPVFVTRYNLATAAPITGNVRANSSTGAAIAQIDEISAKTIPPTMKTEWTELMFLQIRAGNTAMYVFALAVVCVFLALAALYESWTLPLAVILVVPLCLLCAVSGIRFANLSVDIFVQIGVIVLVGLACKNAILIVEFAKQLQQEGKPLPEAAREASRLRLRPILMTSLAFILGVVPLVVARGAGAEMRVSLGTAVFSGMVGVTLFGIFLTPVFFLVIQGIGGTRVFSAIPVRWVGSVLLGITLGLAAAFLLVRTGALRMPIAIVLGIVVGIGVPLLVLGLFRRRETGVPSAPVRTDDVNGGQTL